MEAWPTMSRPRRNAETIEQTRDAIVYAAVRVFAREGLNAASMQDIAREAGYSVPSLYSYFGGKQAMLDALEPTLQRDARALFEVTLPRGLSLTQKLELLLTPQAEWVDANRAAFVFLMRRGGLHVCPDGDAIETPWYVQQFSEWFAAHTTAAERRGLDPQTAAYVLWGMANGLFVQWLTRPAPPPATAVVEVAVRFFVRSLGGAPAIEAGR